MAEISALVPGFVPESDVERAVTADPELLAGLAWGKPRRGHPEGTVGAHVADLLARLDREDLDPKTRGELRLITLIHDSFKYRVHDWLPKAGWNHHAGRARRFAERFTQDERILAAIELHDRPYSLWRKMRRKGALDEAAFEEMLARITDKRLFLRFIELDGSAEGKRPEPIEWFRNELRARGALG